MRNHSYPFVLLDNKHLWQVIEGRAAPAVDYRYIDMVSEHIGQVGEAMGKREKRDSYGSPRLKNINGEGGDFSPTRRGYYSTPADIDKRSTCSLRSVSISSSARPCPCRNQSPARIRPLAVATPEAFAEQAFRTHLIKFLGNGL